MRALVLALPIAGLLVMSTGATQAGVQYPLTLALDATLINGATTITSKVTVRVTQPMSAPVQARLAEALRVGGYPNFVNTLRPMPELGSIETQSGTVPIRFTREEKDGSATRLLLVANQPLFFLGADPAKSRAGYELTLVDLRFDGQGGVTGQLAGAARVKPRPDGGVVLDSYAENLVQLRGQAGRP